MDDAPQIGFQGLLPDIKPDVGHLASGNDPGIVDQDIETAPGLFEQFDGSLKIRGPG